MGSIRRLGDKKYRIVYDTARQNGKRKQMTETLVDVTKRRAEEIYAERIKTVREQGRGNVECATMNALFDRYISSRRSLELAASTLQRYDGLMKVYLRPSLGTMKPSELRANQIVAATDADLKTSGRTRLHAYNLLQAVLNRAVIWDIIPFSPTARISAEDRPKAKRPKSHVLTESELSVLLRRAKEPSSRSRSRSYVGAYSSFFPAVAFAAYTGARRGETLAVRWSDLDLEARTATIARSLADSGSLHFKDPKNGRSRTISISEGLVAILRAHQATQENEKHLLRGAYQDSELVFCEPDGSKLKPSKFGDAFSHLVQRAGITRIRLHDLRDTHASLLARKGIPIQVISTRLGHSSIGITVDRYITMYRDQDDAAALAFESLMG